MRVERNRKGKCVNVSEITPVTGKTECPIEEWENQRKKEEEREKIF